MPKIELTVHAGPHTRRQCPVKIVLPYSGKKPETISLKTEVGAQLPAQVMTCVAKPEQFRVAFILPELKAGESLRLSAEPGAKSAGADAVTVSDNKSGQVEIKLGGDLFTAYRYVDNPARPCFFPLLGPGKKRVTRSWPLSEDIPGEVQDHPHHRSLWVAHGDVNRTDNWSELEGHAYQLHREILETDGGPVFGKLVATTDWTDNRQKKILEERRMLRLWAIDGEARVFDFNVHFRASEGDVRFGDTKEGGILALRVATSIDGSHGGRIENSYGAVGEAECWGKRAQWCDYVGQVEGETLGLAAFDHPSNFRYPTYWHVRNYGMYTANPFGLHDFSGDPSKDGVYILPQGGCLDFRYRVYLHRGSTAEAAVADHYHDFANPPVVEIA